MLRKRLFAAFLVVMAVVVAVSACATPTPQVVEKPVTVVVEKEVPVEKEVVKTVVVEKEKVVEKKVVETVEVRQTVIVEKEVVVEATVDPGMYKEAPELADRVERGELPPVDERLPENPYVVEPEEAIGQYGGNWTMLMAKASDTKLIHVYGGSRLVRWDKTLTRLRPDLCEKFEVNDDGREFILYLRKGVKWSDGEPFTTDDFRFWWEDLQNNEEYAPNGPTNRLKVGEELPEIVFIDDYTVKFTWSQPNKTFLMELAASMALEPFAPKHFLKQFHPKYGDADQIQNLMDDEGFEDWPALLNSRNAWYGHNWPGYPTLQPWVPTARPPQEKYTFVRNPYFYKVDAEGNQLPYLNNLVMLATDRDLLALKCTTGDANLQSRGLAFADITLLKENEEQGGYQTRLWRSDSAAFLRIMPNYCVQDEVLQELFLDRRFRIALSHALNRQEMNDVLFLGYGVPQQVELLPGVPGYNEEFAQAYTAYDPAEANRLLDEMGLTERDSDGYRLRPDGKTLDLIFEDAGENSAYPDAIELITDYYKAIGIKVIYKVSERATYRDRMESGEAPVGMWGSELGLDYRWGEGIVHITGNTDGTNCWGEWYESDGELGTEPPDSYLTMQELASEWLTTYDPDETDQIRDQIRAINAEELYQVGTVAGLPAPVVVADGMRNVPEEGFSLWSRGGYFYWAEPYQFWVEE